MPWKKANKDLIALLEKAVVRYNCDRRVMFGSPTFFINGNMFAGVFEDTVILRLSEVARAAISSHYQEVKPFTPMRTHAMKEYVTLPENLVRDEKVFSDWLGKSVKYATSLLPKSPKRKK